MPKLLFEADRLKLKLLAEAVGDGGLLLARREENHEGLFLWELDGDLLVVAANRLALSFSNWLFT